jgi:hypothetical protein
MADETDPTTNQNDGDNQTSSPSSSDSPSSSVSGGDYGYRQSWDSGWYRRRHDGNEFDWSLVKTQEVKDKWFTSSLRPFLGWLYGAICAFDFIIAPIIQMILPRFIKMDYVQWHPISLEGGGLVHLALGSFIGIYSWGRTKEKIDPNANDKTG